MRLIMVAIEMSFQEMARTLYSLLRSESVKDLRIQENVVSPRWHGIRKPKQAKIEERSKRVDRPSNCEEIHATFSFFSYP
jgi:hypothetical protein